MVFSSPIFLLLFLPLVLAATFLLPKRHRNFLLLVSSLVFYAWGGANHVPLLLFLIAFNWWIGIKIETCAGDRQRLIALWTAIGVNLSGLLYFKYAHFLVENVNAILGVFGISAPEPHSIALPLGISFFTFHLISYVVDVYRGDATAQRNPVNFGLYICFFPQLIAGPIIRYHDVETQLTDRKVDLEKFASGVERFVLGLGKKVLLANPFGYTADRIFALSAADLSAPVAWLGLLAYGLQLYFDFSGYSDMAIGLGRMFGFEYLENFNYPFLSRSISEFWRRWHISLSNWFRDYLYTPWVFALARRAAQKPGARPGNKYDDRYVLALVFLICGIWHGANWTFAAFGAVHGVFLLLERGKLSHWLKVVPRPVSHLYVLVIVGLSWVFFRSESISSALGYLRAMAGFNGATSGSWSFWNFADTRFLLLLPVALLACTPLCSSLARDWRARALQAFGQIGAAPYVTGVAELRFDRVMAFVRPPALAAILVLSMAFIAGQTYNPFIYFRF